MKAYELLEKPESWTQGHYMIDKRGQSCEDDDAVAFCCTGALRHCYNDFSNQLAVQKKIRDHLSLTSVCAIPVWNDKPERHHAEVVALLRELDI